MNTLKLKSIGYFLIAGMMLSYGFPVFSGSFSTNFEFSNSTGSFTLTQEPDTVTFTNGVAKSVGVFSLYRSGSNSWMIDAGETGTIEFSSPAESVTLFFKDQDASINSILRIFDAEGNELNRFDGTTGWTTVTHSDSPVFRITLQNNGASGYAVIDDFSAEIVADEASPIVTSVAEGSIRVRLKTTASGLVAPNWGVAAPGDDTHLYVGDQDGTLWKINLTNGEKNKFLDLSSRLVSLGFFGADSFDERGFLGFAFAPDYQTSGLIYTYTSEPTDGSSDFSTLPNGSQADHKSVILEWKLNLDDTQSMPVQPESVRAILEIEQPQFNHDGGGLNFGPDGFLYIALGDGGGADDVDGQPFIGTPMVGHGAGNAQDTSNPLGALLRIDPSASNAANGHYGIPGDNPFVAQNSALDEIYAYGFRNPFRFSFDQENGDLYLADVGQNDIEEVNVVISGGNYGWNINEGSFTFNPNGNEDGFIGEPTTADATINPVAEYDHNEGTAIIGGFVYRGKTITSINGKYVFGDFESPELSNGRLFYNNNGKVEEFQLTLSDRPNTNVMGFAQDAHGEVYMLGNTTGTPFGDTGVVLKIVANSSFDGSLVIIPVVDVLQSGALVDVYQAGLKLIAGSEPTLFELTPEASILPREYAGDNAIFELSTGRLLLPYVDVADGQGNIVTYSAELQKIDSSEGVIFELVGAQLIN